MQGIMAGLASLGGRRVERIRDVQRGVSFDPARPSEQTPLSLPKSDVLQFFLEGGTTVSARPSGTEPKIKFYINCAVPAAGGGLAAAKTAAAAQCEAIQAEIGRILA
jgi:phosphoglucomutase